MLSKQYRIKSNNQFDYTFKKGKLLKNSKLLVFYSQNRSKTPKFGVVVSKKIGNSVTRNKVKRLIRENIKLHMKNLNKSYNYIFVARQGIEHLNFNQINDIMTLLFKKSEVYV